MQALSPSTPFGIGTSLSANLLGAGEDDLRGVSRVRGDGRGRQRLQRLCRWCPEIGNGIFLCRCLGPGLAGVTSTVSLTLTQRNVLTLALSHKPKPNPSPKTQTPTLTLTPTPTLKTNP